MKKLLVLLAAGFLGLVLTTPASAQYYPGTPGYVPAPTYGYYPPVGGYPAYGRGHYDYVPGRTVWHRGHLDYVPPHVDYHLGGRRYEVLPTPFGPTLSPVPHRHRHW